MEKPKAKICKMSYAWKNGKSFYTFFSTLTLDTFSTSPPLTFSAPLPQPSQSLTHGSSPSISWFFSPSPPLNSLTHKATHNPLISLAPLTQPISLTYLAQFILHRHPPTDRHHPPSSALPSFITVSSLHKHPLLFSLAPSLGSDWQAVVLGFWWLLQSCLCLYVQIRFFIRGFFFFFFFFLGFWFGFVEGFFGFLIWIFGCWWLVAVFWMVGGVWWLVVFWWQFFSSRCGVLGGGGLCNYACFWWVLRTMKKKFVLQWNETNIGKWFPLYFQVRSQTQ